MTSATSSSRPRVLALGVVILDVLAYPVTGLPPVERAHLLDDVRLTAAGTAAATAVDLARLGADAAVCGVVGTDLQGDVVVELLRRAGVDVTGLHRVPGVQTSTSVLPITEAAERLAWHLRGGNATFAPQHIDTDAIRASDAVHVGGPDALTSLGREGVIDVLQTAQRAGALTSLDLLSAIPTLPPKWLPLWAPLLDMISINEHQAMVLTGADDGVAAAQILHDWGVGWSAVTLGPRGCVLVTGHGTTKAPGFDVPVVDTTGCGDAFSAALIMARLGGREPRDAATFANAAAALVATGLGSDAGLVDAAQVDEFADAART